MSMLYYPEVMRIEWKKKGSKCPRCNYLLEEEMFHCIQCHANYQIRDNILEHKCSSPENSGLV